MVPVLLFLGVSLIAWGIYVLVTGDFVATLDIGAGLVGTGIAVIAVTAVVRVLERIAKSLAERPQPSAAIPQRTVEAEPRRNMQPAPPPQGYAPVQSAPPAPPPPAPTIVREGEIEGHHYRFYSDGSIEAEGPRGMRRYRSIDEAREQIMRDREDAQAETGARQRKPEPPPPARPRAPAPPPNGGSENYTPRYSPPRPPDGSDPYAPRYTPPKAPTAAPAPEDEEWSEPFRMLLKGEPGSKPGKR